MRVLDLIAKKRRGGAHSQEELDFLARAAASGQAPDYQLAAWLMAVCFRGMSEEETVAWTRAMARSGPALALGSLGVPKADKHSTGGVGDGISIALAPLVAAAGVAVPMMSGRGLGHTGGTLDKLEALAGFRVRLSKDEIERRVREIRVCMFGQTPELAAADRTLYALRDATATVDSLPLAVSSILSKKLLENLDALVLDVKFGSGAMFSNEREAGRLARALVNTSKRLGLRCVGLLTDMEQPLGLAVGNALEVRQAIEILRGDRRIADYEELLLALGGWMLHLVGKASNWEAGARSLETLMRSGRAADKLREMILGQGGDARVVDEPESMLPAAALSADILAERSGYVARLDARAIGSAAVALGAGRTRVEDSVDFRAGIWLDKKVPDAVRKGERIARLFTGEPGRLSEAEALFRGAVGLSAKRPPRRALIKKVIR